MVQVVLLQRVEKLGQMGDVVTVRPGYARNFLLPQNKALRANKANLAFFETQRKELEAQNLKRKGEAEAVAGKMSNVEVVLIRQAAESTQLYGSVTGRDVAVALTEAGYKVDRNQVSLLQTIKTLGLYQVRVDLHPEVSIMVTANVARSADEAVIQRERNAAQVKAEAAAAEAAETEESAA